MRIGPRDSAQETIEEYQERVGAEQNKRVVIRDNDYYGGTIYVTNFPTMEHDLCELQITWVAYQGGGVTIQLQDREELLMLIRVLAEAADTIGDWDD